MIAKKTKTETVIEMTLKTDTEMLSHGRRNRTSTALEMRVRLKLNAKA